MKEKEFCFCTLALGKKYRTFAKRLAKNIGKYSPGTEFIVLTDKPKDFVSHSNVSAFKYRQRGIWGCFNDRRFVIEKALCKFKSAVHIDADTKILRNIPDITWPSGISGYCEELLEHITRNRPHDLEKIRKVASKLGIPLEKCDWIGESLFVVTKDKGKERAWLKEWGTIASYLELHGMHTGDGNLMGLAAVKANLKVDKTSSWEKLRKITKHFDASSEPISSLGRWQRRIGYHYRRTKAKILALKDFSFYYR